MKQANAFHASADYHHVRCNGHEFRLGAIQAQVVRILYAAARRGEPWQSGKAVLGEAGSRSLKMSDLFKSKTDWPLLIRVERSRGVSTRRTRVQPALSPPQNPRRGMRRGMGRMAIPLP